MNTSADWVHSMGTMKLYTGVCYTNSVLYVGKPLCSSHFFTEPTASMISAFSPIVRETTVSMMHDCFAAILQLDAIAVLMVG